MGQFSCLFVLLSLTIIVSQSVECNTRVDPLVQTSVGFIRGVRNEEYSMFLGIPYAKVDDENPFGISHPYPEFEGIYEANDDSAECPQMSQFGGIKGTLDCLRLNIHVPNSAYSGNLLPVLFYIHGGGFVSGSGAKYDVGPKFLMQHDIILVAVNYRLGPYGFMCLNDSRVPGNQGLRDQKAAMLWVKENIRAFGGDDTKITIFGESAGSASVDLQLIVNKDKIFSKAILQSGTSLSPWVVTTPDYDAPKKLAKILRLDTDDDEEQYLNPEDYSENVVEPEQEIKDDNTIALDFLAKLSPENVIKAANDLGFGLAFSPCIEKEFDNVEPFLSNDDFNSKPDLKGFSILIGTNEDEMRSSYAYQDIEKVGNVFYQRLKDFYGLDQQELQDVEKIVRHYYINDADINDSVKSEIIDFESDYTFLHPTERSVKQYKQHGANIYRYVFSYKGKRNYLRHVMNITEGGATHADEMGYLFDIEVFDQVPNEDDQLFIDRMTTMWANFVKYGDPTPDGATEATPVYWPPITDTTMPYLELDAEFMIKDRPFGQRMAFWDLFYEYLQSLK